MTPTEEPTPNTQTSEEPTSHWLRRIRELGFDHDPARMCIPGVAGFRDGLYWPWPKQIVEHWPEVTGNS